jgi:Grx4 family monothiol glutaredoxin
MSTIKDITTLEDWAQHLASLPPTTLLIISFHAPWAAPCAQMATVLSTLASEYPVTEPPSTSWVAIDAEELSDVSETYNVTAVPFLVLVRDGKVLETVSGSSAVKVRDAIESHAKSTSAGAGPTVNGSNGAAAPVETKEVEAALEDPEKKKEELFKRLGDLVKAAPVMLFMKGTPSEPKCGFSRQLVAILRENAVKYGFFNILADDEVRQGLKEYADWPTFPQLWVDGELVGGLDIVCFLSAEGRTTHANSLCTGQRRAGQRQRFPETIQRQSRCRRSVLIAAFPPPLSVATVESSIGPMDSAL